MPSTDPTSPPPTTSSRRGLLATLGTAAVGATTVLAGCSGSDDPIRDDYPEGVLVDVGWPSPSRDDANTAFVPDGPVPAGSVDVRYSFGTPPAPPTAAEDVLLVPGKQLRAVDPATGETRWTRRYGSWTAPAVRDGVVYVPGHEDAGGSTDSGGSTDAGESPDGTGTDSLVGLDVETGEETWRVSLPGRPTGPVAFSNPPDGLFVPVEGGRVCGVSTDPAEREWTAEVFGEVAAPLAANLRQLFVPTSTGELYSFATTGEPAWRRTLHARLSTPPVAGDRRVYVGTETGGVLALDRADGSLAWRVESSGRVETPMALDGRRLYATAGDLVALRVDTGAEVWRHEAPGNVGSGPVVVDDAVLVGTEQSATEFGHGADDGALVALDAERGGIASDARRWQLSLGDFVGHALAYANGRLFAPILSTEGAWTLVSVS